MKFVIITDTCSDLDGANRAKYNIDYVPMSYTCDEKTYVGDLDWDESSAHEFYELMRNGKRIFTSQVGIANTKEKLEKYLSEGKDILYLSCSSGLSKSYDVVKNVANELVPNYPNSKVIVIDTLRACMALGLLCITASELRSQGKSIDEVASWIKENMATCHMEATVDNLKYLKQAGRVSAASAFFGGLLNIKPILIEDAQGKNFAVEKVKGRLTSLERLVERTVEQYKDVPHQKVFISHADCLDDALKLKDMLSKALGNNIEIELSYIGPTVGASVGPNTMGIFFYGTEVTVNKEA